MLAQLCLEHSRTTSSRHTASSDSFHPPPEPPPPPRAPRGPAAPGAAPCAGCPAAFKPGPACRAAAGGPASAGRAASASSRRSAGPGQRLRTRPHGAILDPPPPARPPRRTHAVCKAARRLTSPRRATPLGGGEVGVASRGHAPPAPPLIHAPSRPPLRGRAPFWARAPLGPNFLQGSVVTAIIAASGISAAPPPLPGSNHHQHHLHSPSHGMVWVRRDSRAGHACPQLPQPRAPAWASSPTQSWCCWQQKEGAVLRQAHTALAYQPMLSSGLGCGILLLIVAAEAPSRLSSWEWREAVVACPPTAHGKYPAL